MCFYDGDNSGEFLMTCLLNTRSLRAIDDTVWVGLVIPSCFKVLELSEGISLDGLRTDSPVGGANFAMLVLHFQS